MTRSRHICRSKARSRASSRITETVLMPPSGGQYSNRQPCPVSGQSHRYIPGNTNCFGAVMSMPVISAHAMVRFLERGLGMDLADQRLAALGRGRSDDYAVLDEVRLSHPGLIEEVTAQVSPRMAAGAEHGAVAVYWGGLTFCLAGPVIVTIIEGRPGPWLLRRADGSRLARTRIAA